MWVFFVLFSVPMMDDIIVMNVHQHSDRLSNNERHPHGCIAIVPIQVATHKPSQRNLNGLKVGGQGLITGLCKT